MRTLEEIRTEMADAASYYEYAKQAGVQSAMDRHEAVYGALAWVLEEPWKASDEFEKTEPAETPVHIGINGHIVTVEIFKNEYSEIERSMWSNHVVTYRHRTRTAIGDAWSGWEEGKA